MSTEHEQQQAQQQTHEQQTQTQAPELTDDQREALVDQVEGERAIQEAIQAINDGPHYDMFEMRAAYLITILYERLVELEHDLESNVIATQRLTARVGQPADSPDPSVSAQAMAERYLAEYGGRRCTAVCPPSAHNVEVAHWCLLRQGHEGQHVHLCVLQKIYELNSAAIKFGQDQHDQQQQQKQQLAKEIKLDLAALDVYDSPAVIELLDKCGKLADLALGSAQ